MALYKSICKWDGFYMKYRTGWCETHFKNTRPEEKL